MPNLKGQLLRRLLLLREATLKDNVSPAATGEFNLVLVLINDQLNLDIRNLSIKFGEHIIPSPPRHADDHRIVTVEEQSKFFADGNMFRTRLQQAIVQLDAHVPPRDSIGFVR
jgi:hypothetical protein